MPITVDNLPDDLAALKRFMAPMAQDALVATEALDRIGQLYAVEKMINRSPPERRRQQRQLPSRPIAEALAGWADNKVPQLSRKSELAQTFRYMRARWTALVLCFNDGRLALDNNPAEPALRCVAIGCKNYLFAGCDTGGRRAAAIYSLIESAKLNGRNPQRYLADLLTHIADHPARRIAELLPWNWQPLHATPTPAYSSSAYGFHVDIRIGRVFVRDARPDFQHHCGRRATVLKAVSVGDQIVRILERRLVGMRAELEKRGVEY